MILPTLFKKSKTGAIVYCEISTNSSDIIVKTGQVGTEKPTFHKTQCEPKNIGKANESTAEQQAITEATAKHTKKIKTGYVTDPSGDTNVRLPMKIKVYQDQVNNVDFPCYDSPKLNGVNYTIRLVEKELLATSRGGETYPLPTHQVNDILEIMTTYGLNELNGEQYIHNMHLQDIQAAVTKPNSDTKDLVMFIFELPGFAETYKERLKMLDTIDEEVNCQHVQVVPVRRNVQDHAAIARHFAQDISSGYEGTVVRNALGKYVHNQRSSDVFKYKEAQDAEFKVVGHKLDKHGHPVFQCESQGGIFSVKLKGTAEQRLAMTEIATSYYGQYLKVEFEVLSKLGKPTKPIGICFRKCDSSGTPTE